MIPNFRDLGGIRTMDGRKIRQGMLVRSAMLARAEEKDLAGVSAVIDLRTSEERRQEPDTVWGREYLARPVFETLTAGISRESGAEDGGVPDMAGLYAGIIRECAPSFRNILLTVMGHGFSAGAVLWHCSEGKDRCGMVTALVLETLGAGRDAILEDYLKTNAVSLPRARSIREQLAPVKGEDFADRVYRAYIADETYLRAAWEAMGGDYIRGCLKIDEEAIRAFRDAVLE
ncbi:MAG: tyrosine-protein phosphatase [Clostridia bacterium]|nr:tyrosine-protein phosphatase [Clostridia bacterium]